MREYAAIGRRLKATDPEVAEAIADELDRERTRLRLIASENYASPAVLAAVGSTMNNKYAEGYPGRRYYGGCEFVDVTEQLAIDRAKELFGAEHANVQPHAGAQANMAVFGAFLDAGRPQREGARHGARARRAPHARLAGERLAACGSTSWATRWTARPSSSTWTASATSRRRSGRRSSSPGYTAYPREIDFAAFRSDRRRGRRPAVGRRVALHRPRGRRGLPEPGALRRRRDLHHAQGAARPARRHDRVPGRSTRRRSTRPCSR